MKKNQTLLKILAIVQPFSTLDDKKVIILLQLAIIWIVSLLISLPESFVLTAVSFLNQRNLFPCVEEVNTFYSLVLDIYINTYIQKICVKTQY